jgi:hypothetical protein
MNITLFRCEPGSTYWQLLRNYHGHPKRRLSTQSYRMRDTIVGATELTTGHWLDKTEVRGRDCAPEHKKTVGSTHAAALWHFPNLVYLKLGSCHERAPPSSRKSGRSRIMAVCRHTRSKSSQAPPGSVWIFPRLWARSREALLGLITKNRVRELCTRWHTRESAASQGVRVDRVYV